MILRRAASVGWNNYWRQHMQPCCAVCTRQQNPVVLSGHPARYTCSLNVIGIFEIGYKSPLLLQWRNFSADADATTDHHINAEANKKSSKTKPKKKNKNSATNTDNDNRNYHVQNRPKARNYYQNALYFLDQVKKGRIQSALVTQKAEEYLLLCLSEHDNNKNNNPSDGPLALDLLNTGLRYANLPQERLAPRLFSLACQIMVRCGHPHAITEVHRQLWRLLDQHELYFSRNKDVLHNSNHVNDACSQFIHHVVMDANRKKEKVDHGASQQIYRMIERLEELYSDPSIPLAADALIEDSIIMFLCNQLKPQEAYRRLVRIAQQSATIRSHPSKQPAFVPHVSSFTSVITGFAKTLQPKKALEVLQWMLDCQPKGKGSGIPGIVPPPNQTCFNGYLHALALSGEEDAGFKAEQTLEWMEKLSETEGLDTRPDETSFNSCMNAWAQSKHEEAPVYAEALLQRIIGLNEAGHKVGPSEEAFVCLMNAWVNSDRPEAIGHANKILGVMEQMSQRGAELKLSTVPYTVLIKGFEKEAQRSRGGKIKKLEEDILQVLTRLEANGVAYSADVFNSVLTALNASSATNAIFYFLKLEEKYRRGEVQLNTRTFNIGLNSIAVLNKPDAEKNASSLLKRMKQYSETDKSVIPSRLTYNIILKVISRSNADDATSKANELLREMNAMSSTSPDSFSYVACIITWGRSSRPDSFKNVLDLLFRFVESLKCHEGNRKTGILVFNAVLSVCQHNSSEELRAEALETAQVAMKKLRNTNGIDADQITYASFFRVVNTDNPEDHQKFSSLLEFIHDEFIHCMNGGFVTSEILQIFSRVAPDTFQKLIRSKDITSFSIPRAWSRNVK